MHPEGPPTSSLAIIRAHGVLSILRLTLVVEGVTAERMRITAAGNVGIGTTNPTYPLSVHGTVEATEVIVQTGWSDYVFGKSYRLTPLSEVESYINSQHHLPGVPSEKQVAAQGVSLGDMQSKLLAQIEQLTLHQIEQEKRLDAQAKEIEALRQANAQLRETANPSAP